MSLLHACALLLAALVGFAAHRASLCTVRAVGEVMTMGTSHMFGSFARAALWAAAVGGAVGLFVPVMPQASAVWSPSLALAGGFLFGVGAALNGGCSLSTVQRLVDGDLSMLATLGGLAAGVALAQAFIVIGELSAQPMPSSPWMTYPGLAVLLLPGLLLWCGREAIRLWRAPVPAVSIWQRLGQPTYRSASAAALMGIAAGALYPLQGAWTYTSFLRSEVSAWFDAAPAPSVFHAMLVASLVAGMLLSARQRKAFKLRAAPAAVFLRSALGGALMGIGVTLIPGGNDTLLLAAIPALWPWALPTYLALISGIASAMLATRAVKGAISEVRCRANGCD